MSRLLDTIVNLAAEDNVVTPDEEAVIEAARQQLWKLENEISQMVVDNYSLDQARAEIKILFEKVISAATNAAKEDDRITSDELILIDRIAKYLRDSDFSNLIS